MHGIFAWMQGPIIITQNILSFNRKILRSLGFRENKWGTQEIQIVPLLRLRIIQAFKLEACVYTAPKAKAAGRIEYYTRAWNNQGRIWLCCSLRQPTTTKKKLLSPVNLWNRGHAFSKMKGKYRQLIWMKLVLWYNSIWTPNGAKRSFYWLQNLAVDTMYIENLIE